MDFDDFDDDIADDDLIVAATQASSFTLSACSGGGLNGQTSQPHIASHGNAFTPKQTSTVIDLDDLPADAFLSSPEAQFDSSTTLVNKAPPRFGTSASNLRQTTLFGNTIQNNTTSASSQVNSNRVFRVDKPPEAPSHHELDRDAMKTWVYPTNLGPTRDYQFSIVKSGLFNNTLVALPTGLGKTFIAATIMLNYYRWMKKAKIIFVAPTKPLVTQQVDACFHIAGIPRSDTTLLTGEVAPALRADEWATKRVFFMTPQTLENDLSNGMADPKSIGLLVVDEAHRATGNYSYVKLVNFVRRFSTSFRILALTATPGSKVEAVQDVIDGLGISHIEIRCEQSMDIRQYIHSREEDIITLDPSDEMALIKELFSKALKPLVDYLSSQNIYYGRDPVSITTFGLLKQRREWMAGAGRHANQGVKYSLNSVFTILQSLAHAIKLLNFHGIKPFYDNIVAFRSEVEDKGNKGSKWKRKVTDAPSFQEMMSKIAGWSAKDNFVSHPKLTYLSDTILNHFLDAGEGREGAVSSTRIIVFSEYRDSAEEIVRVLNMHNPLVRAAVFVGQADSKRSEGMKQSEQIARIKDFKEGKFNVLVATSIGEEGLDIGQVDLIVCYDASASPIRMLQRMGRTGRKRAGRVVLLLMKGKEEDNFTQSKDNYEKMQLMICDGSRFNFRHDLSTRIVPREIKPEVDLRAVEIPIENTQDTGLPEPKRGKPRKKKPPKKFNMPDGVETGFATVSSMFGKKNSAAPKPAKPGNPAKPAKPAKKGPSEQDKVTEVPSLDRVMLTKAQNNELDRTYKYLPFRSSESEDIEQIDLTAHPSSQRQLRKTVSVKHGAYTRRCVRLFKTLSKMQSKTSRYEKPYGDIDNSQYMDLQVTPFAAESDDQAEQRGPACKKRKVSAENNIPIRQASKPTRRKPPAQTKKAPAAILDLSDMDEDTAEEDQNTLPPPPPPQNRARKNAPKKMPTAPTSKPSKSRGRPKKAAAGPRSLRIPYDESADEGDDCRRTSDLDLTDDDDEGSDLVDFVVGDDVATSSHIPTSSAPPTSSMPLAPSAGNKRKASSFNKSDARATKAYFESLVLPTATQDDDDDDSDDDEVPSMSQMIASSKRSKTNKARSRHTAVDFDDDDDDESDEDEHVTRPPQRSRANNRRVFLSDDDDDDDDPF